MRFPGWWDSDKRVTDPGRLRRVALMVMTIGDKRPGFGDGVFGPAGIASFRRGACSSRVAAPKASWPLRRDASVPSYSVKAITRWAHKVWSLKVSVSTAAGWVLWRHARPVQDAVNGPTLE
jgi:hypothetical protein